jgi:hypothetical protein
MFDGADLSAVYGTPVAERPIAQPTQQPQQIGVNPHVVDTNAYGKDTASHAVAPDVVYRPPNEMYAQQLPQPATYKAEAGFWDRIGNKKMEVIKMVILSLIIVLGLSIDRMAGHYLTDYLSKAILTSTQEFMVRISYPVAIVLAIWVIKASM